jgi:hypothetical protein
VVMNRQKHFEVDPFLCFRKGYVVRKAVKKELRNPRPGGSFHEYCREKQTSMVVRKEESRVASNEQQLGLPCDLEHGRQGGREVRGRKVV